MNLYYSKKGLYNEIGKIKEFLGFYRTSYNIDLIGYCISAGMHVESIPFKTPGLRGMAVVGNPKQEDIILLNSHRNKIEQNFDCGHEVIHLCLHRNIGKNSFNCFEPTKSSQNPYLEWHANEGSAEFFVPYEVLLPLLKEKVGNSQDYHIIEKAKYELAQIFNVPEAVITYRIENLKYEIKQYLDGTPLEQIEILSHRQQKLRGISVDSLNVISDKAFNEEYSAWIASNF